MKYISQQIANELSVAIEQVTATINLLDSGNTIPFIARYRKEVTGGLDDNQLRTLAERLQYLRELAERKESIIKTIDSQGKLTDKLLQLINDADNKARLEDLYRPYKPKRQTKGQIAIEAGLKPLAFMLLNDPTIVPEIAAQQFINSEKNINDPKLALEGARYILMEHFADDAELVGQLREKLWQEGLLTSKVIETKEQDGEKFTDYFAFTSKINSIPSHRALAILRGRQEGVLQVTIDPIDDYPSIIAKYFAIQNLNRAADLWLLEAIRWTWKIKLQLQLTTDLLSHLRELADTQAIKVFASNLKDLLMAPPAGSKITMGLDPGLRTGVKVVIIDITGNLLGSYTIYPHPPKNQWQEAITSLANSCLNYKVQLIAIGNGTGSRETDKLVNDLFRQYPQLAITKMIVSEAGASVYSASKLAANEFPNLDVTLRGAVSIARRLQDPLAELVKIEPKSIGVGQYQHDVNQLNLTNSLNAVVEDCVNAVGVDVNTASPQLLMQVAGLTSGIATNIVAYRQQHGPFRNREELKKVTRFGDKAFEQAAGFLRINNGDNPLDASGVHPEAYPLVTTILTKTNLPLTKLINNISILKTLTANEFVTNQFGLPTVIDVIQELHKPGRDPRAEFNCVQFAPNITTMQDLKLGMILNGVITNVADFGAFVDIGVHQDGLIHISELAYKFVQNPREIVKTGDIVTVKVIEVNLERKRIALSMKLATNKVIDKFKSTNKISSAPKLKSNKNPSSPKISAFANILTTALNDKNTDLS